MAENTFNDISFGIAALEERLAVSGLDFLRGMKEGRMPHPPISGLLAYRIVEVEEGRVMFKGTASPEFTNPMGTMHGGWYGTLLDSAMACAVMTKVEKGQQFTTLEFKVNLTRPFPLGEDALAIGAVIHFGRRTAVAEARLVDRRERTYAHLMTTCMVF